MRRLGRHATSTLRLLLVAAAASLATLAWAVPAAACSRALPPDLAELTSGTYQGARVAGVYEQRHIVSAPSLGVRDQRTVSVVTRFWGTAPTEVGRVMHGTRTFLSGSTCGNEAGSAGLIGYGWVDGGSSSAYRGLPYVNVGDPGDGLTAGPLTPGQEQMLRDAFGLPVVLKVSATSRVLAFVQLWWLPAATAFVLTAMAAAPLWAPRLATRHDSRVVVEARVSAVR